MVDLHELTESSESDTQGAGGTSMLGYFLLIEPGALFIFHEITVLLI